MVNNIVVGYSPNDFFYVTSINENKMPSDENCKELNFNDKSWEYKCNAENLNNNIDDCINKELCKNKDKALKLSELENSSSGSNEKYMNEKMNYDNTLMNTINLGIGIAFLLIVIYKIQK